MVERLLFVLLLSLLALLFFTLVKQRQMRQASGALGSGALASVSAAASGQPALLYFRSDRCAACAGQTAFVQQVAERWHGRITIETIDTEQELTKAQQYGVFTLPTTLIIDSAGMVRHLNYGLADSRKLAQQLESIL
jgi:thioredoxin-like negative regulator of GroEL